MSKTLKKISAISLSLTTAVWLSGAAMVLPVASAATVEELQAQINALLASIQALQQQLAQAQGQQAAATYSFTRDLTVGSKGDDVKALQQFLNAQGYQVAASGVGSPGNETSYFGSLTQTALGKYQAAVGISPTAGYFGPKTRAYLTSVGVVPTGPTVPATGAFTVQVDGPAAATIPDGSLYNSVLKLKFSAGASEQKVTSITVSRGGFIANTYITGVSVWDGSGNRYGNIVAALTADGRATISFSSNPFVIPAGQIKSLIVKANISASAEGGTVSFSVASAADISGTTQPSGTFPLVGNVMSVVNGANSLADLQVSYQSVAGLTWSGISSATGNFEVGDKDKEVFKLRLNQNNSKEAVNISQIALYVEGTIQEAKDVKNWRLYSPAGVLLASAEKPVDRFVTFNLSPAYVIDKGLSKDLSVKVDINDGSSNYFRIYVQNDYDIVATGATTGASIQPVDSGGLTLTGSDTQNASGGFKMKAGALTVSRASASPSGNVPPSSQNVILAKFDLKSSGEKLEIRKMGIQVLYATSIALTGTLTVKDSVSGETYLSLSADTASLQVMGAVPTAATLLTYQRDLSSYITVESGQTKTLDITGTTASTATSSANYKVYVGEFYAKRYSTVDFLNLAEAAYEANQVSVGDVSLSVTKNQAFASVNRAKGATNVKIAEFVLQASAADDIRVNSINFDVASSSYLQNMKVMDGTTQIGSTIGTPGATGNSISPSLTIAKSASKVLSIYADVLSSADTDNTLYVSVAASGISGYGVASAKALSSTPSGAIAGQTITIKTGTLTITRDAAAPASKIALAGQTGLELNKIKFESANEDLTLKKITLQLTTASSSQWTVATSVAANVTKVYLYDGATLLNSGGTDLVSGDAVIAGLSLILSQDTPKVLTVKVDVTGSGTMTPKSVGGIQVKDATTASMEVYSSQGLMSSGITLTSNASSTYFLFHNAAPTIANAYSFTGTKTPGSTDIVGKFTITNAGTRTITLASTTITGTLAGQVNTSSSATTFRLYDEADTLIASATGFVSATSTNSTADFAFASFSPAQEISPAGSKTYTVKADTSNIRYGTLTSGVAPILQMKISGAKGFLATDVSPSSELFWNGGNVSYGYTPVGGSAVSGNQASDSYTIEGPSLQY